MLLPAGRCRVVLSILILFRAACTCAGDKPAAVQLVVPAHCANRDGAAIIPRARTIRRRRMLARVYPFISWIVRRCYARTAMRAS